MIDANALDVHDMVISETNGFSRTGNVELVKRVTFYVGDHGPFTLEYRDGSGTPEKINSDINGKIKELREVLNAPRNASL